MIIYLNEAARASAEEVYVENKSSDYGAILNILIDQMAEKERSRKRKNKIILTTEKELEKEFLLAEDNKIRKFCNELLEELQNLKKYSEKNPAIKSSDIVERASAIVRRKWQEERVKDTM